MKICPIHVAIAFLFVFVIILQSNIVTGTQEIPFSATKKQENYSFINEWGSKGIGNGEFLRPHDLEFSNGYKYLYAVDRDGNRIQVFNKNGIFLFKFGEKGQGDGQFLIPYGLDVDARGHIWVADRGNHRIQQFDSRGNFISKFGNEDSHPSSKLGKFDNPRHVEVDRNLEFVYVADSKNNRIQQFDINGTFVRAIGELGINQVTLIFPPLLNKIQKVTFS